MNAIIIPVRYQNKKKIKKKVYKRFVSYFSEQMVHLLRDLQGLQAQSLSWVDIFYLRMYSKKDVLSHEQFTYYVDMVKFFERLILRGNDPLLREFRETVAEFKKFLITHRMDPDNSLIGLTPEDEVLSKFSFYLENPQQEVDRAAEIEYDNLRKLIVSWSKMEDMERVSKEIQRMASLLESTNAVDVSNLSPGDLVVVIIGKSALYARFTGEVDRNGHLGLYTTRDERQIKFFDPLSIFSLPESATKLLGSKLKMRQLVKDPWKRISQKLYRKIKEKTYAFMSRQGVCVDLILRLDVSISDLPAVRRTSEKLKEFLEKPPEVEDFYQSIEEFGQSEVRRFIARLGVRDIFIPAKEDSVKKLEQFQWWQLPEVRFNRDLAQARTALERIYLKKKHLMDGTTKNFTTEWWLGRIRQEVDKFLEQRGYNAGAVPCDYLETPPEDYYAVRYNYKLIQQILDPADKKHQVKTLIKSLTDEIYPEIDRFIGNAQIVLSDQFGLDHESFDIAVIRQKVKEKRRALELAREGKNKNTEKTHNLNNDVNMVINKDKEAAIATTLSNVNSDVNINMDNSSQDAIKATNNNPNQCKNNSSDNISNANVNQRHNSQSTFGESDSSNKQHTKTHNTNNSTQKEDEEKKEGKREKQKQTQTKRRSKKGKASDTSEQHNEGIKDPELPEDKGKEKANPEEKTENKGKEKAEKCPPVGRNTCTDTYVDNFWDIDDPEELDRIEEMLQDVHYLCEMKRLELPEYANEVNKDTVPITGLIIGRFVRMENELRTVLDRWAGHIEEQEKEKEAKIQEIQRKKEQGSVVNSNYLSHRSTETYKRGTLSLSTSPSWSPLRPLTYYKTHSK
eukprot:CAMPEP_0174250384 /NCGR_PEP_ID=MMETSP0439-20130205/574_1 /TAXON_ID=0 /ORGANISM="Stereomyxa ramosa, Strain Chinc5" /LENGTH=847 /DNA_ID=CAMNT_0015330435 /DNA_START=177 /DNA_END=2720 /DNA_ORIENTATION=+